MMPALVALAAPGGEGALISPLPGKGKGKGGGEGG
jgi:hypothetical protein